jgi:hypothetical protein
VTKAGAPADPDAAVARCLPFDPDEYAEATRLYVELHGKKLPPAEELQWTDPKCPIHGEKGAT